MEELGAPAYRSRQILQWIYHDFVWSYDEMVNVPRGLRDRIAAIMPLHGLKMVNELTSRDGTVKSLLELADGKTIEAAFMPYDNGHCTVCVSSQVGCPIGCPFCATGQMGFERNLTPGEIVDQLLYYARRLKLTPIPNGPGFISNLVFMGMGEPLANYKNVWSAIERINAPDGFGLGARNITISTAGVVPQINQLAKETLQVGLAVSLHAPTDVLRDKLVPLNQKHPLGELLPACKEYAELSGRRITFEYIVFHGYNDTDRHARYLAKRLAGINCHVNLIAANRTEMFRSETPTGLDMMAFQKQLVDMGMNCTIRNSRGVDIGGGCGQLRSRIFPPPPLPETPVNPQTLP